MNLGRIRKATFLIGAVVFMFCFLTGTSKFVFAEEIHNSNQGQNCGSLGESECYLDSAYCSWDKNSDSCVRIGEESSSPTSSSTTSTSTSTGNCVNTALGCVPYTINGFSTWLLQILFGIAGGIAFLLMVYGFILIATSSGDEKKVQAAKETITSAITGLLVSIFALFLFRLIAVDILKIPGISGSSTSTVRTGGGGTTNGTGGGGRGN